MRKLARQHIIAHSVAAIFNDHGFFVVKLHERQRFAQHMRLGQPIRRIGGFVFCR